MVPAVSSICVLEGMMFEVFSCFFYWFPNRIIVSFKVRNVVGEGCLPHLVECSFKFIACLVK